MEEEQCPCDDCDATCDYWDSKYCCRRCQWLHGEVEPAPTLYRVTTWFTYQLPNGLRGKTSYKGLMSWDMTGYGDYVLTVSMRNTLACLALQGTYPTTITAVSKEEYEK